MQARATIGLLKKPLFDWPMRFKGNSKCTSGDSLSPQACKHALRMACLKSHSSIGQWGWREVRNALPVIRWVRWKTLLVGFRRRLGHGSRTKSCICRSDIKKNSVHDKKVWTLGPSNNKFFQPSAKLSTRFAKFNSTRKFVSFTGEVVLTSYCKKKRTAYASIF